MEPLRFHQLRKIGRSAAHYKAAVEPKVEAFGKGTGAHSVLLGGKRLVVWNRKSEEGNQKPRRSKEFNTFAEDNADALILLPGEYEQVQGMAQSVRACPEAMRVLEGVKERSVYWDVLGRPCRGTPDVLGDSFVTELKSTRTSDPRRFMWEMLKYGYHVQLAWYLDGVMKAGAGTPDAAFIVAVENSAPYVTTVFRLTERALDMGRRTYRLWLERLQACEESDCWPGYVQCVVPLDVPGDDGEMFEAEEAA